MTGRLMVVIRNIFANIQFFFEKQNKFHENLTKKSKKGF